jgi:hypothetical protein
MWRQEGGFADSVVAVFACDPVEVDLAGQSFGSTRMIPCW